MSRTERRLLLKIDWFILSYCCLMVRLSLQWMRVWEQEAEMDMLFVSLDGLRYDVML